MKKPVLAAVVVVVLVALGVGGFVLFERHERGALVAQSERACTGLTDTAPGTPSTLPLDLPLPSDGTLRRVEEQGSTTVAFVQVPGVRRDLVQVRDQVLQRLEQVGYDVVDTDQEPGYEAEAELEGRAEGTVKVTPLCEGVLEVRYAVSGA